MELGFRWGIMERLAVVGFLAGISGVVASMTAPPWLQAFLSNSGLGTPLFLGSLIVIALAIIFFACDLCLYVARRKGTQKLLAALLIAVGITATISGIVLYFDATDKAKETVFPRLEDYFARDFNFLSLNRTLSERAQNASNGLDVTIDVQFRLFQDFTTNTEFIAVFVPSFSDVRLSEMTVPFLEHLKSDIIESRMALREQIGTGGSIPGSPMTYSKDLSFSGRVFIYTMNDLDPVQIGELVSSYRRDGLNLEIRGSDYLFIKSRH